jgi:hypothetical protein
MPRILAALLGLGLAGLSIYGYSYGAPGWFYGAQAAAALIALVGAATMSTDEFAGVVTLPLLGFGLLAVWLFSLGGHTPAWLRWLNLLAAAGFFAATLIAIVPHRQRFHLGSPAGRA